MPIEVTRRSNEPLNNLLRRFIRRVQGAGIKTELRSHRFLKHRPSRRARRERALYRKKIQREIESIRESGKWNSSALAKIKQRLKYEGEI